MKYCLVDTLGSGHHWTYDKLIIEALSKNYSDMVIYRSGTKANDDQRKFLEEKGIKISEFTYDESNITNRFDLLLYRMRILNHLLAFCKKEEVDKVLFLYADGLLAALLLTRLKKMKCNYYFFLHWFPSKRIDRFMFSLAKCEHVFVHTEYIKKTLPRKIQNKTVVLPYPVADIDRTNLGGTSLSKNRLLYFGGTRKDKGIDILLEALKRVRVDVALTICGPESYFKETYIVEQLTQCPHVVEQKIMLRYVTNEEMEEEYQRADIVVLPYRRTFRGESGVLLEAINHKKMVIAPDILHFREYLEEAGNGVLYSAEDVESLSEAINKAVKDFREIYNKEGCEQFITRHSEKKFMSELISNI